MMKLKNILAENMLRFGTKNLSAAQRNWINEAGTEYANTVAKMFQLTATATKSYEFGNPIPIITSIAVHSSAAFKVAFTSFTPTTAGKIMGFTTKSFIPIDKTLLGWSISGEGTNAALGKHAGSRAKLSLFPKEPADLQVAQSLQGIIGSNAGAAWKLGNRSRANGWDKEDMLSYDKVQLVVPKISYDNVNLGSLKQMASTPSGNGLQFLGQNYNAAFFNTISKYGKVPENNFYNGGVYAGVAVFTTNDSTEQTMSKHVFIPSTTSIGVGAFARTTTKP